MIHAHVLTTQAGYQATTQRICGGTCCGAGSRQIARCGRQSIACPSPLALCREFGLSSTFDQSKEHVRIRAHSHNDYDRPSPLFSALAYGYSSVEADVWLADGQVMVRLLPPKGYKMTLRQLGHHYSHLKEGFTLRSAYVDPLVQMLSEANQQGNS
jgi:hypothetical protein